MRISRAILLLALFVLTQACGAPGAGKPARVGPGAAVAKVRVTELSGCSGDRFRIDLLDAIGKLPHDTLDAQREQLRDWVFTVTLGRMAARTGADEVLSGVADAPLVRDDALAHVLHTQSGPTRSTSTKSGGAVVLVEAADAETMAAEVAEAVDQEALHLGSIPAETQVYQYVFQPEVARADVCAMKPISRAELESAAHRHRKATITTAADLERFLAGGADLLAAQCTDAGLEVTGRQRPRTTRTPITVEHIAALAQARGTRYIPLERFGFSLDRVSNRAQLDANAREIESLRAPLEIQPPDIQILHAWKRQNPGVSMQELMMSLQFQEKSLGRPGFSLDPHTSASFAGKVLDDIIEVLPDVQKVAAILRGLDEEERAESLLDLASSTNEPFALEAKEALIAARKKLQKATAEEAEAILSAKLPTSRGNALAQDLMQVVRRKSTQQCSRYDGPLFGTATGMTFFYTDLLAKLWLIDWNGAAPESVIEGFQSAIHEAPSTTFCDDTGGKNTRIWFGVREESFTRETSGAVRFAPMATRIFARSSNLGARHEEFEATVESKRFVQWWDDHFPEIASWEPQYEVLNQLMKWSVVVQNAAVAGKHACLAPLDTTPVRADHRIDKWVAETSELRWRGPVSLLPPPKGVAKRSDDRECMLLFESRRFSACGNDTRTIAGGVSAATMQMVQGKRTRVTTTPAQFGRLGAEVAPIDAGPGRVRFESVRGSGGQLQNVSVESLPAKTRFTAEIATDVSQVGMTSSWDPRTPIKHIDKSVEIQGKKAVATERKNGLLSAELRTSDLTAADIEVTLTPGTVLEVKAKAQKVTERMSADGVALVDAAVGLMLADTITHLDDGSIVWRIEIGGSKKWVLMESGGGNRGPPARGVEARFSTGVPDGAPHRPGSPEASRGPVAQVSILDDAAGAALVKERKGKPVEAYDPTLATVKDKLASQDVDGAMKALDQNPSSKARAYVLDHAIGAGNDAIIGRVVDQAIRKGASPAELSAHGEKLQKESVIRARSGQDASVLEQQVMKLAIAEARLRTPGPAEASLRGAAKGDAAVYVPASYPVMAELPPAVHPLKKVVLPEEAYVTRAIEHAAPQRLPAEIEVGGTKYKQTAPGKDRAFDYGAVGSPFRLLFGVRRPVRVVLRCDDRDPTFVPCHERPSPEQVQRYEEAMKCDQDGDRRLTTAPERDCLDGQRKRKDAEASGSKQKTP
ncbi:hypothetical protein [Polyangium sp. y55x31]|uniref:hypothetical protein n=1 Tax=Polyangium sp. y55x31 TaxID=3042688 RepID=UPI002482DED9|nr:hypothetical protein [Polyangium sp. y55x31]MDI1479253.1 hypothetical protein [Polyangium sp. y55x31]